MADSSRMFIDILREETVKVLPSINDDSMEALMSLFKELEVESWEDVEFIQSEDLTGVLSKLATRKLLKRLKECGTSSTNIGISGGHNYGTAIGQNTGTVIGKQELHDDQRYKNMCQSSMKLISQADSTDYVSTYAERSALRNLKQFGSIFIKGRSGSGKSRLGLRLLAKMQTQTGRTPVVLTAPAQWDLIPKNQGKYTILIDGIFGSSNLVQSQVDDWVKCFEIMWPSVESGHIFLVITSRPEICANCENRLKRFSIMKNILDVDKGPYQLKQREKFKMLKKLCGSKLDRYELEKISRIKTKLGFPQCCKYFVSSIKAHGKGVAFFEKPHEYILQEVNTIQECDGLGYLALVLVLMKSEKLTRKDLTDSDFTKKCLQYCRNLPQSVTPADMKHKLDSLCDCYLRKQGTRYEFQHQSIYDTVFISVSRDWPDTFMKACPVKMLLDFVRTTGNEETSDTVVHLDKENYNDLTDRITELILSEEFVSDVLDHPSLKEDEFVHCLIDRWTETECLSRIISTNVNSYSQTQHNRDFYVRRDFKFVTLPALMVWKRLHKVVELLLDKCDTKTMKDILPCAISVGDNGIAERILETGIMPNEDCLRVLCDSGEILNNLTDRIFNHVVRSRPGIDNDHEENETCATDKKACSTQDIAYYPRDLLFEAVLGENSRLVELLVDELMQQDEDSKGLFEGCLTELFESIINPYHRKKSVTEKTVMIAEKLIATGSDVNLDYLAWVAAGHPDAQLLKVMLQMDVDAWKKQDQRGMIVSAPPGFLTPLEHAVYCGGYDCVQALLNYLSGHNVGETGCKTEQRGNTVPVSIGKNASQHEQTMSDKFVKRLHECLYLLHTSAERGDDQTLALLIGAGMSVDIQDRKGYVPLHKAVSSGSLSCVQLLIESHASVNVENCMGRTPLLYIGSQNTSVDIVKALLQAGADVNHVDGSGNTALMFAVISNNLDSVSFLIQNGANVKYTNAKHAYRPEAIYSVYFDPGGKSFTGTALHFACYHSDLEIVQLLCEHGARVDVRDKDGETVLHTAAGSRIDAMEKLQYLEVRPDATNDLFNKDSWVTGRTALFPAVMSGDEEVVEFLLNRGLDANRIDSMGCSVLTYSFSGHIIKSELIRLLLQKGADPCMQNNEGKTPLHYAAEKCTTSTSHSINLLLEKGADPCVQDKENKTALHYAAGRGDSDSMKCLLKKGADPCVQDNEGKTPLHYAAERSTTNTGDSIKILLEKGVDPCVIDKKGKTALHYAAERDTSDSIKLLLGKKANPCVQDSKGKTPLHYAAQTNTSDVIKSLLEKESGPYVQDKEGKTALHWATQRGDSDSIKLLLEKGVDSSVQDKDGRTVLHFAAETGNTDSIKLFLKKGADPCVQDKEGKAPLHWAMKRGDTDSIKFLLEKGADPYALDKEGKSLLHYTAEKDNIDIIKILLEKGVDQCLQDKASYTALHYAAKRSSDEIIKLLLQEGADPCVHNNESKTPLHYATERNSICSIKLLLEKGADPCVKDKDGKTALHYATERNNSNSVNLLLEKRADPCLQDKQGKTALHWATQRNDSDSIKLLIENGADPSVQDKDGRTALHIAAETGNTNSIKLFLNKGADPSAQDKGGETALHWATKRGNTNSIKLLLEKGADPCIQDKGGITPLQYAVKKDSTDSIQLLIEKGADPYAQDKEGKTGLHYAAWRGSFHGIKLLLENWVDTCGQEKQRKVLRSVAESGTCYGITNMADPSIPDLQGRTALHLAAASGSHECIKLLLEKGADPCIHDIQGVTPLHCASWADSSDNIKLLLGKGADPCAQDKKGKTVLHYTAEVGSSDSVKLLLENGADPCVRDKDDRVPLHYATESDSGECIKLLIDKGADPCVQDKKGQTVLHYSTRSKSNDSIKLLLENGADLCVPDVQGKTALHLAILNDRHNSIKLLLEKGADPCVQTRYGTTALHYAAWTCSGDIIKLLLEKGADPRVQDRKGWTILHYAVKRGCDDIIEIILESGTDPCAKDKEGKTALHYATERGMNDIIKLLLEKGADPCAQDRDEMTALHAAAVKGSSNIIKLLLEKGADPYLQDKTGMTALHIAAVSGSSDSISHLLEIGADPSVQDRMGLTALHCATATFSSECVRLLLEKGADPCVQTEDGKTALHCAAWTGCSESIKLLLEKGADPRVKDKEGKTASHYNAMRRRDMNVKHLLERGADQRVEGTTYLHYATESDGREERAVIYSRFGD